MIELSKNMWTERTDLSSTQVELHFLRCRERKDSKKDHFTHTKYMFKNFKGEFWYISHELSAEDGIIRSISDEGEVFVPQQGWQHFDPPNTDVCTTVR